MDSKLTLKLNKEVIDKAKEYAASQHKSLSRMIESYLKSLVEKKPSESNKEYNISPFVKSMGSGVNIPADFDLKKEYSEYLQNKHK